MAGQSISSKSKGLELRKKSVGKKKKKNRGLYNKKNKRCDVSPAYNQWPVKKLLFKERVKANGLLHGGTLEAR